MTSDDLAALFARIGEPAEGGASLADIERLRRAFGLAVPYENLSVLSHGHVPIAREAVLAKLADPGRGGYCFELNLAFGEMLRARGLSPRMHLGRVWLRAPAKVPPRNHGTNVVELEGRSHIADVGFGGRAPRCLVPLHDLGAEIDDGDAHGQPVRAVEDAAFGVRIQRRVDGEWADQFSLERTPAHPSDIAVANHYQSTSPDSAFRRHLFAGRFTAEGRDGLFDTRLSRRRGAEVRTRELGSVAEMVEVMEGVFGLDTRDHRPALERVMRRREAEG